jgi:iron complex outermembrane receptor protein
MKRHKHFDLTSFPHSDTSRITTFADFQQSWFAKKLLWSVILLGCLVPGLLRAQVKSPVRSQELKKLSVEELMNLEVISVSKAPEKLTEVASAIQVITGDDINRSTVVRLPEALRLAPNLQVAQVNSHDWAVTARGFNGAPIGTNTLANKLLVMVDGRTVYTPLFGGVFWDVQNVLMEDIDRIEVVSGPGGTLWGANAVNGVINVQSKKARETQGLFVSEALGTFLQDNIAVRYGGRLDSQLFFRVYGQRLDHRSTTLATGRDAKDDWDMTQSGFRLDYEASSANNFTVQGDLYGGKEDSAVTYANGQNLIARWNHTFSQRSNLTVQTYFDRTHRNITRSGIVERLETYDVELQHHFGLSKRHKILWGAGYRLMNNETRDSAGLLFNPAERQLHLFNGFAQDQIALVPRKLELTLGTKLLYNDYTEFEFQPSIRLAWLPSHRHTIWGAVSRAVRTPSRLDADVPLFRAPGQQPFQSEKLIAYELGYRFQPTNRIFISLSAFYNTYDDVRSIDSNTASPSGLVFANNQQAKTWGLEFSGHVLVRTWWKVRGGYSWLQKEFRNTSPLVTRGSDLLEAQDPTNQLLIQSIMDLPRNFQFDLVGRYIDMVPTVQPVPSYFSLDARLAWVYKRFTFSLNGRNLLEDKHAELGTRTIPRSIYQKITLRL